MLTKDDFETMMSAVQDHLAKVIDRYTIIVNALDDENLRLQYIALLQAKQRQCDALVAMRTLLSKEREKTIFTDVD